MFSSTNHRRSVHDQHNHLIARCVLTGCGDACWNGGALSTQTFLGHLGSCKEEAIDCHDTVIADLRTHDHVEHLSAQLGQHVKAGALLFTEFSGIDVPGHCLKGLADVMIQAGEIFFYGMTAHNQEI